MRSEDAYTVRRSRGVRTRSRCDERRAFVFWVWAFVFLAVFFVHRAFRDAEAPARVRVVLALYRDVIFRGEAVELTIRERSKRESDVHLPDAFLHEDGRRLHTSVGFSLRRSIARSLGAQLRSGRYARQLASDEAATAPRYFVHGCHSELNLADPALELFTADTSNLFWASLYSWTGSTDLLRESIALEEPRAPTVLGYVYLLGITEPTFYDVPRIRHFVGWSPIGVPAAEAPAKIFARYGYAVASLFGGLPLASTDAYVFRADAARAARLRVLHRYTLRGAMPHAKQLGTAAV